MYQLTLQLTGYSYTGLQQAELRGHVYDYPYNQAYTINLLIMLFHEILINLSRAPQYMITF